LFNHYLSLIFTEIKIKIRNISIPELAHENLEEPICASHSQNNPQYWQKKIKNKSPFQVLDVISRYVASSAAVVASLS